LSICLSLHRPYKGITPLLFFTLLFSPNYLKFTFSGPSGALFNNQNNNLSSVNCTMTIRLSIITAILALVSCGEKDKKIGAAPAAKAAVSKANGYIVRTAALSDDIELPGTLVANETAEVHPEISGRIVYLNINEGRYVGQGTVLARLFDGDLQARLKKLRIQLAMAQTTEQRQAKLLDIESIPKQDYDMALLNVNTIKADIEILRVDIGKTIIRAPFSGRLGLKNISKGAYITPATSIAALQQISTMKLDFALPEKYLTAIKERQLVYFITPGNSKRYMATVEVTNPQITENNRSVTVRARVQNPDAGLLPGGFAQVSLRFEPETAALMVPTQSIIPQARGKKVVLYQDGVAKFTDVTTGLRDSATIQVTSGLKEGDTILVTGLLSIKPDAKVMVDKIVNGN
jgi:membrane fusion protein, multidrug efflux system